MARVGQNAFGAQQHRFVDHLSVDLDGTRAIACMPLLHNTLSPCQAWR
ncbi:MAG: hypothetical protein RL302_1879, partial [Pseudomonadota bacterium]